jgi:trimeric autotransporter adhesin
MYATPTSPQSLRLPHFFTHWIVGFVAALLLVLTGFAAHAAPPPAGTSISNQASATYTDGSNVVRTVTSNVVQTTVLQVASLTLTANGAQNANPGSVTYYPHTLTNTGNGTDTFNLTTANAGGFTMSNVQIFLDNGSGQPTGPALTSTGLLAAGAAFKFIVVDTLPATATTGQTNTVTVTATSVTDNTKTAANTDVTTVTVNAVVTLTKAVSASSGAAGSGPYTYTLT